MSGNGFASGDRIKVLTGKYVGMLGTVIDPAQESDILPQPRPGYYWARVIIQNFPIPVHVHQDEIQHWESDHCQESSSPRASVRP
jgi:hypothetical protein